MNQLKSNNNFGTSKRIILESVCDKKSEVVQIFLPTKNGNSGSPQILNQTVLERILGITEKCKSVYNQTIRIVTETPHNLYRFLMIKFWPLGKGPTVRIFTSISRVQKSVKGSNLFGIKVLLIEAKSWPLGKGSAKRTKRDNCSQKGANKRTQ